jgi:AraC-like DNA-binding protein
LPAASKTVTMELLPDGCLPLRFSSDDLPEHDRLQGWREAYSRTVMSVEMEPLADSPFRCEAVLRRLPGLGFASFDITPNRAIRTRAMVADGNDDLVLMLLVRGTAMLSARGRDVTLGSGEATLLSSSDTGASVIHASARVHCLALPAARLAPLISDPGAALLSIVAGSEAVQVLTAYVESLGPDIALSTPELRRLMVAHVCDLAALVFGATGDAAEQSRERGIRAVRLQAIRGDIAENAFKASFSIDDVAVRHGVSPRYIRRLFEGTGTTFTDYALQQRLLTARRMLSDPRYDHRTIGAIAFDAGFGDLSYFNRAFRQRFGATPSDIRAAAREQPE